LCRRRRYLSSAASPDARSCSSLLEGRGLRLSGQTPLAIANLFAELGDLALGVGEGLRLEREGLRLEAFGRWRHLHDRLGLPAESLPVVASVIEVVAIVMRSGRLAVSRQPVVVFSRCVSLRAGLRYLFAWTSTQYIDPKTCDQPTMVDRSSIRTVN
jgi:hypothetical protein